MQFEEQVDLGVDAQAHVASLRALIHHSRQLTNVGGERARQAALHPTAAVSSAERADPFFAGSLSHAWGLKRAWDVMHPLFATLMPVPDGLR
jgi:hypothetical protein